MKLTSLVDHKKEKKIEQEVRAQSSQTSLPVSLRVSAVLDWNWTVAEQVDETSKFSSASWFVDDLNDEQVYKKACKNRTGKY